MGEYHTHRRLRLAVVVAALAAGSLSCGEEAPRPRSNAGISLAHARSFGEFRLLYPGQRVLEQPLSGTLRVKGGGFAFLYGECEELISGGEESRCAFPIRIVNAKACSQRPWRFQSVVRTLRIRGVRAAVIDVRGAGPPGKVGLVTGRTMINVITTEGDAVLVARALRSVDGRLVASRPLPPPSRTLPKSAGRGCALPG